MNRLIDNLITFRILHILLQPIESTDAYKFGIIDKYGNKLRNPTTIDELDSYTNLNRLAFKIKQILNHYPSAERDIEKLSASLHLVKECHNREIFPENVQEIFEESLSSVSKEDINYLKSLIIEDAPINNASATPGIAGFTPEDTPVKKKKIIRRKVSSF